MSSKPKAKVKKKDSVKKRGIDLLLTKGGKSLAVGQEIRFTLIKGPANPLAPDPVNPGAPQEQFPLVAKFPESVVRPDFRAAGDKSWAAARLYQQDVPKALDDSDDEAEQAKNPQKQRRWRTRRKELPKRQWILQEQVEFLQTMVERRQAARSGAAKQRLQDQVNKVSSRYEGIPEHNPSQYFLLEESAMMQNAVDIDQNGAPASSMIQVSLLPTPNATIAFAQPNSRKTLSMSEAEEAIQDQRGKMTRFMMHEKRRILNGEAPPVNASKTRLFGKLKQKASMAAAAAGGEEDDDDIMGDVAFRNRKGSGKRARKELLDTLGDSGLKVDADGVLGGANDSEFGRGVRFGRFQNSNDAKAAEKSSGGDDEGAAGVGGGAKGGSGKAQSFDGLAMADDFYQRDVGAEYEELDYDANEQFDDDDVDLGESEMIVDGGGFAEDEEDDDLDENEMDGDAPTGAEGLASIAGFRLMLAKARGEVTPEQAEAAVAQAAQANANRLDAQNEPEPVDHLAQMIAAAEKRAEVAEQKSTDEAAVKENQEAAEKKKEASSLPSAELTGVEVDENGLRLITLAAVRREIWLHHGAMPLKRVTKIFGVKKGGKERQAKFKEVVKELCTMRTDPVNGRMLVLKQHYSQMG